MKTIMTRAYLRNLCSLLIVVLSLSACAKDALEVKTAKTFIQSRSTPATDLAGGGMTLTLKPGGNAGINPGGDIVWNGNYNISGKKITVKVQETNTKYKFTIISDQEIHGDNGEVLKLVSQ